MAEGPLSAASLIGGVGATALLGPLGGVGMALLPFLGSMFAGKKKQQFPMPMNLPPGFINEPGTGGERIINTNTGQVLRWSATGSRWKDDGMADPDRMARAQQSAGMDAGGMGGAGAGDIQSFINQILRGAGLNLPGMDQGGPTAGLVGLQTFQPGADASWFINPETNEIVQMGPNGEKTVIGTDTNWGDIARRYNSGESVRTTTGEFVQNPNAAMGQMADINQQMEQLTSNAGPTAEETAMLDAIFGPQLKAGTDTLEQARQRAIEQAQLIQQRGTSQAQLTQEEALQAAQLTRDQALQQAALSQQQGLQQADVQQQKGLEEISTGEQRGLQALNRYGTETAAAQGLNFTDTPVAQPMTEKTTNLSSDAAKARATLMNTLGISRQQLAENFGMTQQQLNERFGTQQQQLAENFGQTQQQLAENLANAQTGTEGEFSTNLANLQASLLGQRANTLQQQRGQRLQGLQLRSGNIQQEFARRLGALAPLIQMFQIGQQRMTDQEKNQILSMIASRQGGTTPTSNIGNMLTSGGSLLQSLFGPLRSLFSPTTTTNQTGDLFGGLLGGTQPSLGMPNPGFPTLTPSSGLNLDMFG